MKLNAEELVVTSFETSAADAGVEADVNTPLCTILPTRCTQCLPCD
jgi:hypothetical protein